MPLKSSVWTWTLFWPQDTVRSRLQLRVRAKYGFSETLFHCVIKSVSKSGGMQGLLIGPLQVASSDGKSEGLNSNYSLQPRANGICWPWPSHIFFFPEARVLYNDKTLCSGWVENHCHFKGYSVCVCGGGSITVCRTRLQEHVIRGILKADVLCWKGELGSGFF